MFPVTLDLSRIRVLLVGDGAAALRRLRLLDGDGARHLTVFAEAPSPDLAAAAGGRLRRRLPRVEEIAAAQIVFCADLPRGAQDDIAAVARAEGTLLNVEDQPAACDFQSPAVLRRGDLTIAISTSGRSPGLAVRIKHFLATIFGPEWHQRLDELAVLRGDWREAGADSATITGWTEEWIDRQGLLPGEPRPAPAETATVAH